MNEIEDVFAPYISIDDIGAKIESKSSENQKKYRSPYKDKNHARQTFQ